MKKGCVSAFFEGEFPRYVWYKDGRVVYEARLINKTLGQYKGYPLNDDEWPEFIENFYE